MNNSKPKWLRVKGPGGETYTRIKALLKALDLHTVCENAQCPNAAECWGVGTATIMILGDICTRGCRFCAVESGDPHGELNPEEPEKVASAVDELNMTYTVITSVDRDDLPDGGAGHYARTISAIKTRRPDIMIEALIPDFQGDEKAITKIVEVRPEVIGHNVETVERLTPKVRDRRSGYVQSLDVLRTVKRMDPRIYTKSSIMVGLGETEEELLQTFRDLRSAGVNLLTIGQYLRPSEWHIPVEEYVTPNKFDEFRRVASDMGFLNVASGPLVRSSYKAGELLINALSRLKKEDDKDGG